MAKTKVHMVPAGMNDSPFEWPENCHVVCYADQGGYTTCGISESTGVSQQELSSFASYVNNGLDVQIMDNRRVTMLPGCLVLKGRRVNEFSNSEIIKMLLALWERRMNGKLPKSVVFVISNAWNPDVTAFHNEMYNDGYNIPSVKDLYVLTM